MPQDNSVTPSNSAIGLFLEFNACVSVFLTSFHVPNYQQAPERLIRPSGEPGDRITYKQLEQALGWEFNAEQNRVLYLFC